MQNKTVTILFIFFFLVSFTGCETIADCLYRIEPNLISKELNVGTRYQSYNDNLTFEMIRANDDDYLISDVSIEGNLPPNISYSTSNNNTINFTGTPNVAGNYPFTVTITVHPYVYNEDGSDDLCGNKASKHYEIIIIN